MAMHVPGPLRLDEYPASPRDPAQSSFVLRKVSNGHIVFYYPPCPKEGMAFREFVRIVPVDGSIPDAVAALLAEAAL